MNIKIWQSLSKNWEKDDDHEVWSSGWIESATDEIKSSFLIVPFTSLVFTSIIANIYEFFCYDFSFFYSLVYVFFYSLSIYL